MTSSKRQQKRKAILPKERNERNKKPGRIKPKRVSSVSMKKNKKEPGFLRNALSVSSGLDIPFLFLVLIILIIGLVMLFSASYPNAFYHYGDSFRFIKNQLVFAALGITLLVGFSRFDYNRFRKLAVPILGVSFVFLIIVLLMPARNGVHRWFQLGLFDFQASEFTKFAIAVSFAHFITLNFHRMNTFKYGILPYLLILGPTAILLALEPHISCTVIIVLLAGGMLFVGGVKLRWFAGVLGAIALGLIIFAGKLSYASNRIAGWLDPFGAGADTWQIRQGLYAIGSGGIWGLGLGNSRQKYLFIPEPENDFIFAVVCEELGFVGAVVILVLFALLIWRGMLISMKAPDKFGVLLGVGLTAQVGLQVILNIAVVTNTVPNTGIGLPFFSYGGTSLLMLLAQMGIILSISRSSRMEKA